MTEKTVTDQRTDRSSEPEKDRPDFRLLYTELALIVFSTLSLLVLLYI